VAEIVELYFTAIKFLVIYLYMSLRNIIHKFLRQWPLKGLLSVWSSSVRNATKQMHLYIHIRQLWLTKSAIHI
jgi:hypothetical protein